MSEWREETEAEERGGQAGWGLGGTVLLSLNAVQWQLWPKSADVRV